MECSHESARKACVCVPHAHDLIYEALVLTRIYVADDHTEIGAQRWNLTNLHTLPLEARWVENQLQYAKMDVRHSVGHQSNSRISQDTMLSVYIQT